MMGVMDRPCDWFGAVAGDYARHRLTYPPEFFTAFLRRLPAAAGPVGRLLWDCGCGNGQAALALAQRGVEVIATDASADQLAAAFPHPRIRYRCAEAAASGLADASVDGVVVAAAVHWFAGPAFNREVRRVCRPGSPMAWIGYLTLQALDPAVDAVLQRFYHQDLAPWWPPERRWVEASYAGLDFPGREWPFPDHLCIERHWNRAELVGNLGTWSAVQRARSGGDDPLSALSHELAACWPGDGDARVGLRWPFMGRWGVVEDDLAAGAMGI
jgi:SAM-dependent methyltransferase